VVQSWIPTIAAVDLDAWLEETLGRRHPVVAVGVVRNGEISVASRGAGVDADYEIGSISKGITGLLYVQALERGEIEFGLQRGEVDPVELGGWGWGLVPPRSGFGQPHR
jgi:hypothetical protein